MDEANNFLSMFRSRRVYLLSCPGTPRWWLLYYRSKDASDFIDMSVRFEILSYHDEMGYVKEVGPYVVLYCYRDCGVDISGEVLVDFELVDLDMRIDSHSDGSGLLLRPFSDADIFDATVSFRLVPVGVGDLPLYIEHASERLAGMIRSGRI